MPQPAIYMDCHATTPVDPRVAEIVQQFMTRDFGNASSAQHSFGDVAHKAVEDARGLINDALGAGPRWHIVFTSGATESNNLAIRGLTERADPARRRIVGVVTEHKAVLDPLVRAAKAGFDVKLVGVRGADDPEAGVVDLDELESAVTDDTLFVSVMLANNEIGVIQPLAQIAEICRRRGALLFCDAVQALGKIPVDVKDLGVDLLSVSAHKLYGPKGVGALCVKRRVRLAPQLDGGGHERGVRSGTLNVPGIVGFARAVELAVHEMPAESARLSALRNRLFAGLRDGLEGVFLNGPALDNRSLDEGSRRLPNNLNCSFAGVDGDALMAAIRPLAVSSGSACTSTDPQPSHVVSSLGRDDILTRASLRFGLGRFNTEEEVGRAIEIVVRAVQRLRG